MEETLRTVVRVACNLWTVVKVTLYAFTWFRHGYHSQDNNNTDNGAPSQTHGRMSIPGPDIVLATRLFCDPSQVNGYLDEDDMFRVMIALAMHDLPSPPVADLYDHFRGMQRLVGDGGHVSRLDSVMLVEQRIKSFLKLMRRFSAAMAKTNWRMDADEGNRHGDTYDEDWDNIFGHYTDTTSAILGLEEWWVFFFDVRVEPDLVVESPMVGKIYNQPHARLFVEMMAGVREARGNDCDRLNAAVERIVCHAMGQFKVLIEVHKILCDVQVPEHEN